MSDKSGGVTADGVLIQQVSNREERSKADISPAEPAFVPLLRPLAMCLCHTQTAFHYLALHGPPIDDPAGYSADQAACAWNVRLPHP